MANEKRLIDASAWKAYYEEQKNNLDTFYTYDDGYGDAIDQVDDWMDAQPTVDAVEVVHGYWIDSTSVDHLGRVVEHSIDCSVCECVFKDDSREVVKRWKERFEWCPFCGAKMDAKE